MTIQSGSSRLWLLFEAALDDYEKQTGMTLEEHPLAEQLQHCYTVESVTSFLQNQVRDCSGYQGIDRIMESLNATVSVLHSLSASFDNLGSPFPLVKATYAGFAVLLATVKDIGTLNLLVDLLESIELLLKHLDIYTKIPPTIVVTRIVVQTLVELLSILAVATSLIKQRRPEIFAKKHSGREYVETVVERFKLDRLTLDEARTVAARILGLIHGLVRHMKVIMKDGKASIDCVREAQIMHSVVSDVNKSKRDELQQNVISWLSPPDPSMNHKIACELRYAGTAAWFFQGHTFAEWMLSERNFLLWIHGKSGAGKSVLCSAIIQSVDTMRRAGFASLAYFYCDFRDDKKKSLRGLLSSLLVQLCHQSDFYCDTVSSLYQEQITGSHYTSDDALRLCLKKILKRPGQAPVYLILDALDECPIASHLPCTRDKVLMLVRELMTSQFPNIRICVTSQPEADIRVVLEPLSFRSISLHDESGHREDIARYIKSVVNTDPNMRKWRATNQELVINVLTHKVDGIFRWASCQVAYLRHCPQERIRCALDDLPETLDVIYRRTLRDIDKAIRVLAHRLFSCVSVAHRPLRAEELAELLALNPKRGPSWLFRRGWRQEDLVNAVQPTYPSLLAIVKDGNTTIIQFSHFSVQEFFENAILANASADVSYYHVPMVPTHTLVAQACLDVLLRLDKNVVTRDSLRGFPLAEYAAEHWVDHARFGSVWKNVENKVKRLFDPNKPYLAICIWIHNPEFPRRMGTERAERPLLLAGTHLRFAAFWGLQTIVEFLVVGRPRSVGVPYFNITHNALHLAAKRGHVEIVRFLLKCRTNVTARNEDLSTPLHLASQEGQLQVARILIGHNADVSAQDKDWLTPLHLASQAGQLEVTCFLINRGADVNARDMSSFTPLHLASREGQLKVARFLIEHRADVNAQNKSKSTPLHLASREGQLEIIRFLIDHDAYVDARDTNRSTPLYLALREGQLEVARTLINYGADIDARDMDRSTPLYLALRERQLEVARTLINYGADIDARDKDRSSLLHLALHMGQLNVARFLIEYGADVNAQNKLRSTPLHLASRKGQLEIIRFLIDHDANVDARDMDHLTPLYLALREGQLEVARILIDYGADIDARDMDRSSVLHLASREGQLEVTRFLIDYGADVNARDMYRSTPLHLASREGQLKVTRFLIDFGADVNARDMYRSTPLHLASQEGRPKVAHILLEHGADSEARDNDNCTPLHLASQLGRLEAVDVLIKHGTDINPRDMSNWTPLHGASEGGHLGSVQLLLENNANIHASDLGGWTSLQLASCNGDLEVVKLFLKYGADANARDNSNWTPLHGASRWGHWTVVQVLLMYGADVNARDNNNWTPLHWASQRAHRKVIPVLLKYHADVNPRGDGNQTPLHLASRAGYLGIVELLVESSADIHVRSDEGCTPFGEALVKGHRDIMRFISKKAKMQYTIYNQ